MELPINKRDIAVPEELSQRWQSVVDTMAEVIKVPAASITRIEPPYLKVLRSSESGKNPYQAGSKELLAGLYCETVVLTKRQLLVPNALKDGGWNRNPTVKSGFISYLGLPLLWPDGEVFGTIYVLDTKENRYGGSSERLLSKFRELIEAHLALLYQSRKLELLLESLGDVEECIYPVSETAGEVIITTDQQGVITFWNRAAASLFGYPAAEIVAKSIKSIIPERFRQSYQDGIKQLVSTDGPVLDRKVLQIAGVRRGGIEFPMELTLTPWKTKGELFFTALVRVTTERKHLGETLQRQNRELTILNTFAQSISQSMKLDEILQHGLDSILETMNLSAGGIYLADEVTGEPVLATQRGLTEELIEAISNMTSGVSGVPFTEGTVEMIATADAPSEEQTSISPKSKFYIKGSERDEVSLTNSLPPPLGNGRGKEGEGLANNLKLTVDGETHYIFTLPLQSRGKNLGTMAAVTQSQNGFSTEQIQLLETMSRQLGVAVDNAQLFDKTEKLSITDELTGLYNHRYFHEVLQAEIQRALRYRGTLSLIMLDLDGFKQYNDRFGHVSGDAALQAFGQTLRSALRKTDLAFRYGGDEFAIILPATVADQAKTGVDHVRAKWLQVTDEQHLTLQTTLGFSAGIAQFPDNAETADVLILLSDAALYHSKRAGKYKCTLVSELGTVPADVQSPATLERVHALLAMADARNPQAYDHAKRVAAISEPIGEALGLQPKELAELNIAALLHDLGKVGVTKSILGKPDKLTGDEQQLMRKHPAEGARIASYVLGATAAIPMILHHHEWYDGTGYPAKLKSEEIPLGARIIAVADAYCTMTTEQASQSAISHEEALKELERCSGTQFDPKLVRALGEAIHEAGTRA